MESRVGRAVLHLSSLERRGAHIWYTDEKTYHSIPMLGRLGIVSRRVVRHFVVRDGTVVRYDWTGWGKENTKSTQA